jgi:hypothetical protein
MHGLPKAVSWAELAMPANVGDTVIVLWLYVDW